MLQYRYKHGILQRPLFRLLLITLNFIPDLEIIPIRERNTALGILAHGLDILLLILDAGNGTWIALVQDLTSSSRKEMNTYHHE